MICGVSSLLGIVQENYRSRSNRSIQLFANSEIGSQNLASDLPFYDNTLTEKMLIPFRLAGVNYYVTRLRRNTAHITDQ